MVPPVVGEVTNRLGARPPSTGSPKKLRCHGPQNNRRSVNFVCRAPSTAAIPDRLWPPTYHGACRLTTDHAEPPRITPRRSGHPLRNQPDDEHAFPVIPTRPVAGSGSRLRSRLTALGKPVPCRNFLADGHSRHRRAGRIAFGAASGQLVLGRRAVGVGDLADRAVLARVDLDRGDVDLGACDQGRVAAGRLRVRRSGAG